MEQNYVSVTLCICDVDQVENNVVAAKRRTAMFTQRRLSINQRDNHRQIAALSLSHPANCIAATATAAAAADVGSGIPGDHSPVPFQWRNKGS